MTTRPSGVVMPQFTQTGTGAVARYMDDKVSEIVSAEDFSTVGDGSAEDFTNLQRAITACNGKTLKLGLNKSYKVTGTLVLPASIDIDFNGSTIFPYGTTQLFSQPSITPVKTTTITSGSTIGSRSIVVADATGISIGQRYAITSNYSPTEENVDYPAGWGYVTNVSGTTITLDRTLEISYLTSGSNAIPYLGAASAGTAAVTIYFWTTLNTSLTLRNGTIDGTHNGLVASLVLGAVALLYNIERVKFKDLIITNYVPTSNTIQLITAYYCPSMVMEGCTFIKNTIVSEVSTFRYCDSSLYLNNKVNGSHFGLSCETSASSKFIGNHMVGHYKQEVDDSASPLRSIRAHKCLGNLKNIITDNTFTDYESGVKIESGTYFCVDNNQFINMGLNTDTGQVALNISSQTQPGRVNVGSIIGNTLDNCGGIAIGVADQNSSALIIGNKINHCHSYAIYAHGKNNVITNNNITDWDSSAGGTVAIICDQNYAHVVDGNTFSNSITTTTSCMDIQAALAKIGINNVCYTANPVYKIGTSTLPILATFAQSGTTTQISHVGKAYTFNCLNTKVFSFTVASGAIEFSVSDSGGSYAAKFFADNASATITILSDVSSHYENSSTPASSKVGVYKTTTSSTINVKNNTGGTVAFSVQVIGQVVSTTDPT